MKRVEEDPAQLMDEQKEAICDRVRENRGLCEAGSRTMSNLRVIFYNYV
jgi:hypothetical protein